MAVGGAPTSAGTTDTRVDRPEEGLPGLATTTNPTANPPTRAAFDAGLAAGGEPAGYTGVIDTTETARLTPSQLIKRGKPAAW
jgi:hypothetical protein